MQHENNCCGGTCGGNVTRRTVLKHGGLAGLAMVAGPFARRAEAQNIAPPKAFVPADKTLSPQWVKALYGRGETRVYRGDEMRTIGMPIGGIAAGTVYLTGDGRLAHWDIFNQTPNTGPGLFYRDLIEPTFPIAQGFSLTLADDEQAEPRTLDRAGFPDVSFIGEYPVGRVTYVDEQFPIHTELEAFSPFIPLNAADSALPATVLRFTLRNTSDRERAVELRGHLENAVLHNTGMNYQAQRRNEVRRRNGMTMIAMTAEPMRRPADASPVGEPEVFADFEDETFGDWTTRGESFGAGPVKGRARPRQKPVTGYRGERVANSFHGGDNGLGKLISPTFEVRRPYINFLIGGGNRPGTACVNLIVDGQVVRTASAGNDETLEQRSWYVADLQDKPARIEAVDDAKGPWGHVNFDHVEFADEPGETVPSLDDAPDNGTAALAVLGDAAASADATRPTNAEPLIGELSREVRLAPGETKDITFIVAWHFPNRAESGQFYATRFADAPAVAEYLAENIELLREDTLLWHATYYDSTLPHWLLDRVHMPVSTLATTTTQWWDNGRYWGWEGVGCCRGTCTHVYNYAQATARLFPELERSAREMQDFGVGFQPDGMVGFRGNDRPAADGQAGTICKAYREHLMSADDAFLTRNWGRIQEALQYCMREDQDGNGILEGAQHNTFDIDFYGPNTFVGSLYLAALRAGQEMAKRVGNDNFAEQCRQLFEAGSAYSDDRLFDGEYYFQQVDLDEHARHQYGHGCLADQVFGQNWATQLGLGYLYDPDHVRAALASVYKYNWTPDTGPYNERHEPERWYATPGEGGLFICTFPKSDYLDRGVRYREEVWTGIEYQVASHMFAEGMLTEGLAVVRALHERYDPSRRNPWNEVECGDHYARALASWGCLLNLAGYAYDGPAGHLGFDPQITPDDFRCAFTGATGWGTYAQQADRATVALKWGSLSLTRLITPVAATTLTHNGQPVEVRQNAAGDRVALNFERLTLAAGDELILS